MNRLATETSPYLLQHADNPVDWYPWGEEAFERARAEQKPILLSVGYSACHWCHVMAHESFEDAEIAQQMNESFINVKVDREERPDVDSVYMTFTQALTGQGGWPMTVFLTPDLQPFYAGTYFPPTDQHGRPAFPRLLASITNAWSENRDGVLESAASITEKIRDATARATEGEHGAIAASTADQAVAALRTAFDPEWGGFGRAPKFPSPSNLEFLLTYGARVGDSAEQPSATEMVLHTCRRMASGGMYDHLGGGFARYSVDQRWLVPHFEKMLYDNAQLVRLYLHAYQVNGDEAFATVARETLDYLLREMTAPEGGFYAAQDADSEGIEGKFFVWTPDEVDAVLGDDGLAFRTLYAVSAAGNFEDPHHPEFGRRTVLSRPRPIEAVARDLGRDPVELAHAASEWRQRLLEVREQRVHPGLDDKVLTSWNGLALAAFAEGARVLDEPRYREAAIRAAAFLQANVWREGRLLHTYKDGIARVHGLLEDYAYVGLGLVELYRATGDLAHLHWASELFEVAPQRFRDDDGTFFEAPADGEALLLRQKPFFDAPTPSGNAAMAQLGFWLGRYFGRSEWEQVARDVVQAVTGQLARAATGFGATLQALELLIAEPREVAIVGPAADRAPFEREVARRFLPSTLVAPAEGEGLPILEGRAMAGNTLAYVCRDMVCELPATDTATLREQLNQ